MKMQKGLCVKMKNGRSIFLLEDGRFLEGRAVGSVEVGEESYFKPVSRGMHFILPRILAPIAAIAAALMLLFAHLLPSEEAYAYIQLEAKPGIELGVDKDYKVISIRELNEDGRTLLKRLGEWEGHALNEILSRSFALAAISEADTVTITVVSETQDELSSGSVKKSITSLSTAGLQEDVQIHLKKATFEQWRKSVEEEVPVSQKVKQYTQVLRENNAPAQKSERLKESNIQTRSEAYIKKLAQPEQKKKEILPRPEKEAVQPIHKDQAKPSNPRKETAEKTPKKEAPPKAAPKAIPEKAPKAIPKPAPKAVPEKAPKAAPEKAPKATVEKNAGPVDKWKEQKGPKQDKAAEPEKSQKQSADQNASKNK